MDYTLYEMTQISLEEYSSFEAIPQNTDDCIDFDDYTDDMFEDF